MQKISCVFSPDFQKALPLEVSLHHFPACWVRHENVTYSSLGESNHACSNVFAVTFYAYQTATCLMKNTKETTFVPARESATSFAAELAGLWNIVLPPALKTHWDSN